MKKNKLNKKLMGGIAALSTLAIIGGGMLAVNAAGNIMPNRSLNQEDRDLRMAERDTQREAVESALENADFTAWQAASVNSPMLDQVNEENFPKFVEAHNLMEEARVIMEDIGIDQGPGMGNRMNHDGRQGREMERGQGRGQATTIQE